MRHIFSAELCAKTNLVGFLQQLFLEIYIAEGASCLVTRCRQAVIEMRACEFDGKQVLLGRSTTDDDSNMIRRTSCGTEGFHFLYEERNERARILNTCLRLLVEISLIGTTSALRHAQETILCAVRGFYIDLRRQVAFGVHLVVHVERCILRITQIALGVGIEHTAAEGFFVLKAGPYLLSFLAVNNRRSGILAER